MNVGWMVYVRNKLYLIEIRNIYSVVILVLVFISVIYNVRRI